MKLATPVPPSAVLCEPTAIISSPLVAYAKGDTNPPTTNIDATIFCFFMCSPRLMVCYKLVVRISVYDAFAIVDAI
jgi:hypothetical protein